MNIEEEKKPIISVLMSVFNESAEILSLSIESIIKQTFIDFEFIIILDNPNNIDNKNIIESFSNKDKRIKFYINEKNLGLATSLNKALSYASGLYIARMDADDISLPNRLLHQKKYLEENDLDFIGGYVETINDKGEVISPCVKVPITNLKIRNMLKFNNCLFHPTWFLKKDLLLSMNGYSNEYRYIEDYEFILRVQKTTCIFGNLPEIILKYRMSTESISRSNLFKQYLSFCFLQNKYFKQTSQQNCVDEYIKQNFSDKESRKYLQSSNFFSASLELIKKRCFIRALLKLFLAFSSSKYYRRKIIKYIHQYFS